MRHPVRMFSRVLGGRYEIVRKLGSGAMGEVYEARRLDLGGHVAVKVLHRDDRVDPMRRARFLREAQALAIVSSPNVVGFVDYTESDDDDPCLVMELLVGQSLDELVRWRGPFSLRELETLVPQLVIGLAAVHAAGIVHRDIKPRNVVLVDGGVLGPILKIVDFGLAKLPHAGAPDGAPFTRAGAILGTPAFMAPEQSGHNASVDARSDIYGLAATFIALATGRPPISADAPLGPVLASLPAPLRPVLGRALSGSQDQRHDSLAGFASELSAALAAALAMGDQTSPSIASMPDDNDRG